MDLMTIYDRLAGLHEDAAGFEAERQRVLQEDFDRAAALSPALREKVNKLRDGEEGARHAMDLLHQRFAE